MNLNKVLADIAVLKQKAYNMHWNVRDKNFMSIHKMTESLYEGLIELFDEVAEKIAMEGKLPLSTLKEYLKESSIKEEPTKHFTTNEIVKILSKDLNQLLKDTLKVKGNNITQTTIDTVVDFTTKQKWFFESSK